MNIGEAPNKGGTSYFTYLEDSKRRLQLCDRLLKLDRLLDAQSLLDYRILAIEGCYEELYHQLLTLWKSNHENSDLIMAISLSGLGAGLTPQQISEDMTGK